jgi:hypothetical protein
MLTTRHQPIPGDPGHTTARVRAGFSRAYAKYSAMLTMPELIRVGHAAHAALPVWPRGEEMDAAPAAFVPYPQKAMGGPPEKAFFAMPYKGLAPSYLFPLVQQPKPWQRGGR